MLYTLLALIGYVFFKELEKHGHDSKFPERWGSWWNRKTAFKNKRSLRTGFVFKHTLSWTTGAEHFFKMLSHWSVAVAIGFAYGNLISLFLAISIIWLMSWLMSEKVLELNDLHE